MMSIVYINDPIKLRDLISIGQSNQYPRLIMCFVFFVLLGQIIIKLATKMVIYITNRLVMPIKSLKKIFVNSKNKKISQILAKNYSSSNTEMFDDILDQNNENGNLLKNDFINIKNNINNNDVYHDKNNENNFDKYNLITESELDDLRNSLDEDEEEEETGNSEKVKKIFEIILNLKEVINFAKNPNEEDILKFIFAKKTFMKVNKQDGRYICESNLGNISLKFKKYDKAIFHLLKSLKDPELHGYIGKKAHEEIKNLKNISLKKSNNLNKNNSRNALNQSNLAAVQGNNNSPKINVINNKISNAASNINKSHSHKTELKINLRKMELIKKVFLNSRYPKIIFAFKKYFKNLVKILKNKENSRSHNHFNNYFNLDMYVSDKKHTLKKYKKVLLEYIMISENYGEVKKTLEALIEYNEFLIKYGIKQHLRSSNVNSEDIKNNFMMNKNEAFNESLERLLLEIRNNFIKIDKCLEPLKINVRQHDYLEGILNQIRMVDKDSYEMIETPIHVLCQKAHYLKGKLALYCEDYKTAAKHFFKAKTVNMINDALIIKKSLKKLNEIVTKFKIIIKSKKSAVNSYYTNNHHHNNVEGSNNNILSNLNNKNSQIILANIFNEENNLKLALEPIAGNSSTTIHNLLHKRREKDCYNYSNNNSNNNVTPSQLLDLMIKKFINFSENLKFELSQFKFTCKNICILISRSISTDQKKILNCQSVYKHIFNNLITEKDNISCFVYDSHLTNVLNSTNKNMENIDYITTQMEQLFKNNLYSSIISYYNEEETASKANFVSSNMIKAIENAYKYIKIKMHSRSSEKWIVVLTDRIHEFNHLQLGSEEELYKEYTDALEKYELNKSTINNVACNKVNNLTNEINKRDNYTKEKVVRFSPNINSNEIHSEESDESEREQDNDLDNFDLNFYKNVNVNNSEELINSKRRKSKRRVSNLNTLNKNKNKNNKLDSLLYSIPNFNIFKEKLFKGENDISVILIDINNETSKKMKTYNIIQQRLNFNKSALLEINQIQTLKTKMRVNGDIKTTITGFMQERYNKNFDEKF